MNVSLESLQDHLKKKKFEATIQTDTQQVYAPLKLHDTTFPLFVRIYEEQLLVQLITFLPCEVERKTAADLSRLLHLFNKELDIPGFGLDEIAKIVFFRCMVPTVDKKLSTEVLDSYLKAIEFACTTFTPSIEAMASGQVSFDEMINKAKAATRDASQ